MARAMNKRSETSSARMELRIPPAKKAFIQRAMAVSGHSAAELAYEGARRVLEEHEKMVLEGRDRDAFLAAVRKPPQPNARLKAAMRRHDKLAK